jgi:guanine nucleotide-binding protein G(i) subunit alpha
MTTTFSSSPAKLSLAFENVRFTRNSCYSFIEGVDMNMNLEKWGNLFEHIHILFFTVDLACYALPETDSKGNRMMQALSNFAKWANLFYLRRSSVILFLCNIGALEAKLATNPLQDCFDDYVGGNDATKAAKYILWRFKQQKRAHQNLYPIIAELHESSSMSTIFATIQAANFDRNLDGYLL